MPTNWHDSAKKVLEDDTLVGIVLRDCVQVDLGEGTRLTPLPQVVSDKPPADLTPDLVFAAGPVAEPARVVVVEIQKEPSRDKRRQWPRYLTAFWTKCTCPVDLLVVCPDEAVARWCAEPIRTSLEDFTCRPKVLPPSRIPAITCAADVAALPGLGVLSVAYHGAAPGVANAFVAGMASLDPARGKNYYDYGCDMSAPAVRLLLEELMNTTYREIHSPTLRKEHEEGREEGREGVGKKAG